MVASAEVRDFYQDVSGPLGYWDGYSSHCFVNSTYTLDPVSLHYGDMFGCADISGADPAGTRAALRIDGRDAFLPAETYGPYAGRTGAVPITGFARRLDPASGDASLGAALPALQCANGAAAYPPACPAWADGGLRDDATTVGDHGGRLVRHTDVWTNTGTTARQLDVWYRITTAHAGVQWRFPGEAAFAGARRRRHDPGAGRRPGQRDRRRRPDASRRLPSARRGDVVRRTERAPLQRHQHPAPALCPHRPRGGRRPDLARLGHRRVAGERRRPDH